MDQSRLIDLAFDFCMRAEGNATYTDDPDDAGGPTKFGLALNYNRDVLPDKNGDGYINAADVRLLEREDARQVWELVYWRGNGCHLLPDALAFIYADMVFNPGPGAAPKLLQQALRGLGCSVAVDGIIGAETREAIGRCDPGELLVELTAQRLRYYGTRSKYPKYGLGWDRRSVWCLRTALGIWSGEIQ